MTGKAPLAFYDGKTKYVQCDYCGMIIGCDCDLDQVEAIVKNHYMKSHAGLCGDYFHKNWDDVWNSFDIFENDGVAKEDEEDPLVEHPPHYTNRDVECIDWIEMALTPEEFRGYLKGCQLKYFWRHEHKGKPVQDLEKMRWYARKLEEKHGQGGDHGTEG